MSTFRQSNRLREEQELVKFASFWHCYGGPAPSDIFVNFGVTADLFFRRLRHILEWRSGADLGISFSLHSALLEHADMKCAALYPG